MPQLAFPFSSKPIFSADNFVVSGCNKNAFEVVNNEKLWVSNALYLCGEKASGKSHLAYIFSKLYNAQILSEIAIEKITGNCVVEDIENMQDEKMLFHLFNHCKENNFRLLLTSTKEPKDLIFKLPDLVSRLRACQFVRIDAPDDTLMITIMRKQFSDRQLLVDDEVINYLATRIERSFSSIKAMVDKIDSNALSERKNISIPFVKKLLIDAENPSLL